MVIAALHPIVLYQGGALRWYPVLWLAHALRTWSLWSDGSARRRELASIGGAVLGAAAGYLDALFLVHDGIWWASMDRARRARAVAGVAALTAVAVHGTSLALLGHGEALGMPSVSVTGLGDLFTWIALGPLGEAMPLV